MATISISTPNGLQMSAEVKGAGKDILLLHGIPGSAEIWRAVADELSRTHRVIVPDLIGFGASSRTADPKQLWVESQAEALVLLLEKISAETVCIVGHDFGGPVASRLYSISPATVSSLVLVSTNLFGDTPIPFPLSGILLPGIGRAWARLLFSGPSLKMMVKTGMGKNFRGKIRFSHYTGDSRQTAAIRAIFTRALRHLKDRYAPVEQALKDFPLPSAVIWGDQDPFFSAAQGKRTAKHLKTGRFVLVEGAGHFLPEEAPETIISTVRELC